MTRLPVFALIATVSACGTATGDVQVQQPSAAPTTAHRALSREVYAELIAIDTTQTGSTFAAAQAMAKRLLDAGYAAAEVEIFEPAKGRGNLVARLRGSGKARPILLMAHLDVVPALREDWSTNPFTLVEADGYFYGRGTTDDKFRAAAFIAAFIRFKQEGYKPDRDIILVLQTDEEIGDPNHVGITWLLEHHKHLVHAELALNENGWLAAKGRKLLYNGIQVAEKAVEDYVLEIRNRGGHSSQPRTDNAIYELSEALLRIRAHAFPIEVSDAMRRYFEVVSKLEGPPIGSDITAILAGNRDTALLARIAQYPFYNAMLRTTCVATRLEAGVSAGALPSFARATVSCRIMPGHHVGDVQKVISELAGAGVTVTATVNDPPSAPSTMKPEVLAAVEKLTSKFWPGTPVVQTMSPGASDSLFLRNAGIPSFGHSGMESDLDDFRMHGRDERVRVEAFYASQQYLYELVKLLAGGR